MNAGNRHIPDPPLFCATITPHRSLSRKGFVAVMAAIGGISFIGGIVFLIAGAWPVVGFLGLDVLLVYWAFRANFRAANAVEIVTVTPSEITVRRRTHRGKRESMTFNPLWIRLERRSDPEFGIEKLLLVSRNRKFPIANFLTPGEKESFAIALAAALQEAKRGPTRTVLH